MGRSVATHSDSVLDIYFDVMDAEDRLDFQFQYEDPIVSSFVRNYPSLYDVRDHDKWLARESKLILENRLVAITLQTYMNVASLSFIPDYYDDLAYSWIMQNREGFYDLIPNRLVKDGTMSNGVSVYNTLERTG